MGDAWGGLALVGPACFMLVALVLTVVVVRALLRARGARHPPAAAPRPSGPVPPPVPVPTHERRRARREGLFVIVSGLALPWVVGLAVKAVLDARGEPTYPVAGFLEPAAVVVLLTATVLQWCWPFVLLGLWMRSDRFLRAHAEHPLGARLLPLRAAHLAGLAAGVAVFIRVFRIWDVMYVFVPLGLFLLPPMAAGYGLGRLAARRRAGRGA